MGNFRGIVVVCLLSYMHSCDENAGFRPGIDGIHYHLGNSITLKFVDGRFVSTLNGIYIGSGGFVRIGVDVGFAWLQ